MRGPELGRAEYERSPPPVRELEEELLLKGRRDCPAIGRLGRPDEFGIVFCFT